MKKILIVVALLCFVVVGAFAQSQQNQESAVPLTVLITGASKSGNSTMKREPEK